MKQCPRCEGDIPQIPDTPGNTIFYLCVYCCDLLKREEGSDDFVIVPDDELLELDAGLRSEIRKALDEYSDNRHRPATHLTIVGPFGNGEES